MLVNNSLIQLAAHKLFSQKQTIVTAESCTAGLLGWSLTSLAGSSAWYLGGINAYANSIKINFLDVPPEIIDANGVVSCCVAELMASNIRRLMFADIGVSITGIAGPGGGSLDKPVGTVCFGFATKFNLFSELKCFSGSRDQVRIMAVNFALDKIIKL